MKDDILFTQNKNGKIIIQDVLSQRPRNMREIIEHVHKMVDKYRRRRGLPRWDWHKNKIVENKWNQIINLIEDLNMGEAIKIKLMPEATVNQMRSILYMRKETMYFRWSVTRVKGGNDLEVQVKKTGVFLSI